MVKKVVKKDSKELKIDKPFVAYILGILSIVQAFFIPLSGLVLGIIGLILLKGEKSPLLEKSKKLNLIGIIISAALFIIQIILNYIQITTGVSYI
jgi:hypothetical protein